jgi:hypothetical protein
VLQDTRDLRGHVPAWQEILACLANHVLHEKLDNAILTTQEVDPGIFHPGSTLKSPNNAYFAIMRDCSFAIYKGAFTTSAERLAEKYIVAKVASAAGSNCHIDLQRDGNLGFYAQFLVQPLQPLAPAPNIPDYMSPPLMFWQSQTSNGGNDDYWLVLLDSGQLELHAGTPFADEGALYRSKLLASKAIEFVKVN